LDGRGVPIRESCSWVLIGNGVGVGENSGDWVIDRLGF
jgi:hypothetical protein